MYSLAVYATLNKHLFVYSCEYLVIDAPQGEIGTL
jgi:hypothetical protein